MSMPLIAVPKDLQTTAFLLGSGALKSVPEMLKTYFREKHHGSSRTGTLGNPLHTDLEAFFNPKGIQVAYDGMTLEL